MALPCCLPNKLVFAFHLRCSLVQRMAFVVSAGSLSKLRYLGVQAAHMHNLTELVQHSLVLKRSKGQSRYDCPLISRQCPKQKI